MHPGKTCDVWHTRAFSGYIVMQSFLANAHIVCQQSPAALQHPSP
jgi:hypothetical protein